MEELGMEEPDMEEEDSLFPEDMEEMTMEEDEELDEEEETGYLPGISCENDFLRDGRYVVQAASGIEAWKQWCSNCLATERFSSPLYSTDFGISTSEAFAAGSREEAEAVLVSEITEAIGADPYGRADHVNEISFQWGTDSVTVLVDIEGVDGASIDVEAVLGGNRS